MTPAEIKESLSEYDEEILTADGFDDALIGLAEIACKPPVAAYDYNRCVEILVAQGMDETDAIEHMSFNVTGANVGKYTPVFIHDWRKEEGEDELEEVEESKRGQE